MNVTAFTDLLQQQFFAKRSNATKIVYKKVQNNCNAQPTLAPFYTQAGVFFVDKPIRNAIYSENLLAAEST